MPQKIKICLRLLLSILCTQSACFCASVYCSRPSFLVNNISTKKDCDSKKENKFEFTDRGPLITTQAARFRFHVVYCACGLAHVHHQTRLQKEISIPSVSLLHFPAPHTDREFCQRPPFGFNFKSANSPTTHPRRNRGRRDPPPICDPDSVKS
ncbi:hypothetical protein C8F04DRAFT_721054 [Mycena alexandri]|uniref:Secreted protein n=1 Tax=Mycena alexandri TaxID=1745969 RepID=A0AAD6TDU7_9AGAR|nr:hypothetical protein C8F04DRAFT_721054 [Mycena alexandri]